jgi:hypothetical protein
MGSNNYAGVITDSAKAREVVAKFEELAAEGATFKVIEFNPEVDRFAIAMARASNFPTLPHVEDFGTPLDGGIAHAKWSKHSETIQAIFFGNGYFGLSTQRTDCATW